jgi:hypothetical protein
VPLAVVRWPKLDQLSITVNPAESRAAIAMCALPLASVAAIGM